METVQSLVVEACSLRRTILGQEIGVSCEFTFTNSLKVK